MDGTMECIEVPENARLKSHQRDATWHEAVISVSLHHPTRSHHHQGIEICLIWFPPRWLDNSPTLPGNDYSKGSGKGAKDAKAWEKFRKRISSCFWRSCDCFDDASILNGHDIVGEKGRQRAKKRQTYKCIYIYIYFTEQLLSPVPCWPFFHYSNWKSSLGWQVIPWKRHSTKSHATPPISIQPRCLQGLVRGLLASNALPVTKWDPSAAVGKVTSWAPSAFHSHNGFCIAVLVAWGWVGQRWGCFGTAIISSSFPPLSQGQWWQYSLRGRSAICHLSKAITYPSWGHYQPVPSCVISFHLAISVAILWFLAV